MEDARQERLEVEPVLLELHREIEEIPQLQAVDQSQVNFTESSRSIPAFVGMIITAI